MYVLQAFGAVIVLAAIIVFTVRSMHPVYATRGSLGDQLRARTIAASDSSNLDRLMATPKFQDEKQNFYEDVMRLKQVDSARADSIAQYAVREAYVRGISPAIIFGVMLTENSKFVSTAKSNVGAVGLMQVYPKVWLTKEMTRLFGKDLASDSTNVKYGVFILSQYFNPKTKGGGTTERDWASALLRYNGCVKGTNTPRCHTYPDKVQNFVENQATSICNGRTFYDCIAKPFIEGLFTGGKLTPDDSSTKARVARVAALAADSASRVAVAAGEVTAPAPDPIALPPVVVTRPDSILAPAKTPSKPAAKKTSSKSTVKPSSSATRKKSTAKVPSKKKPTTSKKRTPTKKHR